MKEGLQVSQAETNFHYMPIFCSWIVPEPTFVPEATLCPQADCIHVLQQVNTLKTCCCHMHTLDSLGFKKRNFSSFCTRSKRQKYDTRCEICSVPGAEALGPPPSLCPTANPSLTPYPGTKALGLPPRRPAPVGTPFLLFVRVRNDYDTRCEICSVPGARAPTTYPPGTEALGPPPEPLPRQAKPSSTSRHENICRRRRKQRSPGSDAFN